MTYIPALGKQVQGDGRSSTLAPSLLGAAASWLSSCFCIQAVGGEQAGVPARCGCACGACHKPRFIARSLLALRSDVSGEDGDAGGPAPPTHPCASYRSLSASLRVRHALGVRLPPLMSWLPPPPSVSATLGASLHCLKPGKDAPAAKALTLSLPRRLNLLLIRICYLESYFLYFYFTHKDTEA